MTFTQVCFIVSYDKLAYYWPDPRLSVRHLKTNKTPRKGNSWCLRIFPSNHSQIPTPEIKQNIKNCSCNTLYKYGLQARATNGVSIPRCYWLDENCPYFFLLISSCYNKLGKHHSGLLFKDTLWTFFSCHRVLLFSKHHINFYVVFLLLLKSFWPPLKSLKVFFYFHK